MRRRDFLARALPAAGAGILAGRCGPGGPRVRVGAKTYSEQLILGEMAAQLLEGAGTPVIRRLGVQTFLLHEAVRRGDLDCYVEYTGTAWTAIMRQSFEAGTTAPEIYRGVRQLYRERFDLLVSDPLGFSNDYVVAATYQAARDHGLRTLSDLARTPGLTLVAGYPFFERQDGFPGMIAWYEFEAEPETREVDIDLVYQVVEAGDADVLVGNSTDGRIAKLGLVPLEDDRAWFPPYESALVYRPGADPSVHALADLLPGQFDNETMRSLNERVDLDGEDPALVAADFIERRGLALPPRSGEGPAGTGRRRSRARRPIR